MKYRLTPGNGLFLFILGASFYYRNAPDARDRLGGAYLLFAGIFILIIDFFLQLFINDSKKLLLIELACIATIMALSVIP